MLALQTEGHVGKDEQVGCVLLQQMEQKKQKIITNPPVFNL